MHNDKINKITGCNVSCLCGQFIFILKYFSRDVLFV